MIIVNRSHKASDNPQDETAAARRSRAQQAQHLACATLAILSVMVLLVGCPIQPAEARATPELASDGAGKHPPSHHHHVHVHRRPTPGSSSTLQWEDGDSWPIGQVSTIRPTIENSIRLHDDEDDKKKNKKKNKDDDDDDDDDDSSEDNDADDDQDEDEVEDEDEDEENARTTTTTKRPANKMKTTQKARSSSGKSRSALVELDGNSSATVETDEAIVEASMGSFETTTSTTAPPKATPTPSQKTTTTSTTSKPTPGGSTSKPPKETDLPASKDLEVTISTEGADSKASDKAHSD